MSSRVRSSDRLLGIALGIVVGLAIVAVFVFVFSEDTVDAPSIDPRPQSEQPTEKPPADRPGG